MKIVRPTTFGGPEVLQLLDEDTPSPGPGEVLVAVRGIDVNPVDWKLYSGAFGSDPALLGAVGTSVAGVVAALGSPGLTGPDGAELAVGDAVVARGVHGTAYAEQVVADASALRVLPDGLGFEEAAALLVGAAPRSTCSTPSGWARASTPGRCSSCTARRAGSARRRSSSRRSAGSA